MEMIPKEKSRCGISAKTQEKGYRMGQLSIIRYCDRHGQEEVDVSEG